MNPTIRAVANPIAFRCKVNLVTFICVPDRFAAPVHRLCNSSKKKRLEILLLSFLSFCSASMTHIFRIAKNINWQLGSLEKQTVKTICQSHPGSYRRAPGVTTRRRNEGKNGKVAHNRNGTAVQTSNGTAVHAAVARPFAAPMVHIMPAIPTGLPSIRTMARRSTPMPIGITLTGTRTGTLLERAARLLAAGGRSARLCRRQLRGKSWAKGGTSEFGRFDDQDGLSIFGVRAWLACVKSGEFPKKRHRRIESLETV
jgi:hypothetical protein